MSYFTIATATTTSPTINIPQLWQFTTKHR